MLLFLLFVPLVSGICYTPDGSISNDFACNPSDTASVCCQSGFLCMSNGLCQPPWWTSDPNVTDQFIRGTCTDKTWSATQCRGYCVKENPGGGELVYACGNKTESDSSWCCASDTCCSDSSEKITIGAALVTATAGVTSSTQSTTSTVTSSSTSSTAGAASATTTNQSDPTASTTPAPASSSNSALAAGLGGGLGGLAAIAIAAGAFFFYRRRKRQNQDVPELGGDGNGPLANPDNKGYYAGHSPLTEASANPVYEAPSEFRHELPTTTEQMPSAETRQELPNESMHDQRYELGTGRY